MRFILAILFLLLASPCAASTEIVVIGQPAMDYSDIILWAGFEDGGGDDLETSNCNTGTDTTWARDGSSMSGTNPLVPNYSLLCDAAWEKATLVSASGEYINAEKGAIVLMIKPSALGTGDQYIFRAIDKTSGWYGVDFVKVSTDEVRFQWGLDGSPERTATTSGADIATGTVYYLVGRYNSTADTLNIDVFDSTCSALGTPGSSTDTMTAITTLGNAELIPGNVSGGFYAQYDQLVIFDGSIVRTAQQYCDTVRNNSSCPR